MDKLFWTGIALIIFAALFFLVGFKAKQKVVGFYTKKFMNIFSDNTSGGMIGIGVLLLLAGLVMSSIGFFGGMFPSLSSAPQ